MTEISDEPLGKYSGWIPVFLLLLPMVMVLRPLLVEIPPKHAIYFTPWIPILFQLGIIGFAIGLGVLKKPIFYARHPVVYSIAAFFAVLAVYTTTVVALNPVYSALKLADLMLFAGVSVCGAFIMTKGGPALIRKTLMALFGSYLIAVPLVTFLIANRIPDYYWWPVFIPGFDYIRIYGFSLTAGIAVGTGLLALPEFRQAARKWGLVLCLGGLWAALLWTSSRGGILALLLVYPTAVVLVPALRKTLVFAGLALLLGIAVSSQIKGEIKDIGLNNTVGEIVQTTSVSGFAAGRIEDWSKVLDFISERPLLGHGYAQANMLGLKPETGRVHTHNIVLEAILAWGVIGGACAGFLIVWLWFRGLARTRAGDLDDRIPAFLTVSVLLIYAWVDGVYFYYQSLIPMAICTAILVARPKAGAEA